MFRKGILNPALLNLLARARHTNSVVIADRSFSFWPLIETVDISLVAFKKLLRSAIGLVRTGDTVQYANLLIESA